MSRLSVQGALELAVREHQAGRLDDAMALYQHVLTVDPRNADALHLSGMVELSRGRLPEAIGLMERALGEAGKSPPSHFRSNLANAYREARELERAESEYREAIATGGGTPEVFNNLGLTLVALGRPTWAIEQFEHSLARRPRHAGTWTNLSVACLAAGAGAEALRCADEALALEPGLLPAKLARAAALVVLDRTSEGEVLYRELVESAIAPGAVRGLSDLLIDRGATEDAIAVSSGVVTRHSGDATAWQQHGVNLARAARVAEAERAFAKACELQPRNAAALGQWGAMLLTLDRTGEAASVLQRATQLDRTNAEAWGNLSAALLRERGFAAAIQAGEQAARWSERSAASLLTLGAALLGARRFAAAEPVFREVIATSASADAWNGLGVALERTGRVEEALSAYAKAVELDGAHTVARVNHAETLLLTGDFARGWQGYESRFAFLRDAGVIVEMPRARWSRGARRADGSPPRVLLIMEQGLGDAIQFVRYAALVRREAARVIVRSPEAVRRLVASAPGVDEVIGMGDSAPEHDFAIHAMSLPREFGTTVETVPCDVPYLRPDAALFEAWGERLSRTGVRGGGVRVALAWAGSPGHSHDASRSMALSALMPLAAVSGVEWFSVQKGPGAEQLAGAATAGWRIMDLGASLNDMSETAAVLAQMDLVITVDTSVAHLAGAIGARTWTLLAHPPEWRWMLERRDTPWYPTMTLFRQREVDQWGPVVARVRHRLERLVRSKV
ncbi:MAG: tetratricopeptide repeat protein [Phycisphaerales bacterium]|nr:tetratricopeptide repeat protein [Phycisphaerales bacterium]